MNYDKFYKTFSELAEIRTAEPMKNHTTLRIGGPADTFCVPPSIELLCSMLSFCKAEHIPCFVLGGGANVLVGDKGIRGVVLSTEALTGYSITCTNTSCGLQTNTLSSAPGEPHAVVRAEAGLPIAHLAEILAHEGWSGFEFTASLPGTLGGAVFMNARCYNHEIADILKCVQCYNPDTHSINSVERREHTWEYKRTPFMQEGALASCIIVSAEFFITKRAPQDIYNEMNTYTQDRIAKGHFDYPSAGSMFKNNRAFGRPTGMILDELGFCGKRIGDAMVSPRHANIFVNAGNATAHDMLSLIKLAQEAALKHFGFALEPEVVFIGEL